MESLVRAIFLAALIGFPVTGQAQAPACGRAPMQSLYDPFGPYGGCAPWSAPWEYDTGGDNDRRRELPRFKQGGGQQTGGPARNLLHSDSLHIVPR